MRINFEISKKGLIIIGIVIVAIVGSFLFVKSQKSGGMGGMPPMMKGSRGGNTTVSVRTQELKVETLHGFVTTNGEIESVNSVSVFPDTAGKIMETSVMLGSKVSRGEVIGYVDPSTPGSYFKKSPVYAPISGSVISIPLKNGTTVSTSTAICIIGDINNLQITANVPERYVSVLKVGLKANITLEAYPDDIFVATVKKVSPVVDSTSRTKQVVLQFDKKDSRINAGMFAKVKLFTEDYEGAVTMPSDAVVQNGEDFFVYVVNADSTVSKVKVETGKTVSGVIQILKGVKEGERVVIQGQTSLANGTKIQDISMNQKSNKSDENNQKGEMPPLNGFDKNANPKNAKKDGRK